MLTPDIEMDPAFEPAHQSVLHWILQNVRWDERMRARKTASFGVAYCYSEMTYPDCAIPEPLLLMARRLKNRLGYEPNNTLLNLYETGESSMGFHSDSQASVVSGTDVSIVSLGAERTLRFKHKVQREHLLDYRLKAGSLVVMRPSSQEEWLHAIPPEPQVGVRVSVTFRKLLA